MTAKIKSIDPDTIADREQHAHNKGLMISMVATVKTEIMVAVSTLVGLIALGTISFHYLEGWTWVQCFYFSVITLTTVGYGDLYPTSDASRLFTAFYVLLGVSATLASIGIIGTNYIEKKVKKSETSNKIEEDIR